MNILKTLLRSRFFCNTLHRPYLFISLCSILISIYIKISYGDTDLFTWLINEYGNKFIYYLLVCAIYIAVFEKKFIFINYAIVLINYLACSLIVSTFFVSII